MGPGGRKEEREGGRGERGEGGKGKEGGGEGGMEGGVGRYMYSHILLLHTTVSMSIPRAQDGKK